LAFLSIRAALEKVSGVDNGNRDVAFLFSVFCYRLFGLGH